ncbi:MAG: hemin ABC transporter ATP-binding protein [Microbacteriaceae bacterium BACL25 MAG-120322-bin65]|nr:MAG: hemin ABC transporter ATP-binding protein [Microbacteriaceae bacterium BACL25 MAG-120322-bin65]HAA78751.1 heme ABC transporter ATP-binding protein [Microbacteriaceae bacterium]
MIELDSIGLALDGRAIIKNVSLQVFPGEVLALVGPNGAGKSSILSVMAGDVRATSGTATLGGKHVGKYRPDEAARVRSVLMQSNQVSFPFTVQEIVEMGRAPWARTPELADDDALIQDALRLADVEHLVERRFNQLSGGEKARVSLARVLAQRTPVMLLDEPTAALDLRHQESVMRAIRTFANAGCAIVVVLHDLSIAAGYADRIAMIVGGKLDAIGTPDEVIVADRVSRVYGVDVDIESVGNPKRPVILPQR